MGLRVSKDFGIESADRLIRAYLNNVGNIFSCGANSRKFERSGRILTYFFSL